MGVTGGDQNLGGDTQNAFRLEKGPDAGFGQAVPFQVGDCGRLIGALSNSNDNNSGADLVKDRIHGGLECAASAELVCFGSAARNEHRLIQGVNRRVGVGSCADQTDDGRSHGLQGANPLRQLNNFDAVQKVSRHQIIPP